MIIAIDTKDKLKVRDSPVFLKVPLSIFLLFGVYNFYQLTMGVNIDPLVIIVFFIMPLVLLNFYVSRVVLEMGCEKLTVTKIFLFRRKTVSYKVSELKDLKLEVNSLLGSKGTYSIQAMNNDFEVSLLSGFADLNMFNGDEVFNKMNLFINRN